MRISDWSSDVCSSDLDRQQRRDVELGLAEAHLQRQAVQPVVLVQLAPDVGLAAAAEQRTAALDEHQDADEAEENHVAERDDEIELAEAAQEAVQPHPEQRAEDRKSTRLNYSH